MTVLVSKVISLDGAMPRTGAPGRLFLVALLQQGAAC
jgi:hypothetical protein